MTAPPPRAAAGAEALMIKPSHAVVRDALAVANIALGRPVTPAEVGRALTLADRRLLHATYGKAVIGVRVAKVLDQLQARGLIFSAGRIGAARYYGHPQHLIGIAAALPTHTSRRQRVLMLLRGAVTAAGAPVQSQEVIAYAATRADARDLTRTIIIRDLSNLLRTGEAVVLDTVRGGAVAGTNLYLPADVTVESLREAAGRFGPRSWLQEVEAAVATTWGDECARARTAARRPRPFTTSDVRAALAARAATGSARAGDGLADARLVPNAMLALAGGSRPYLRIVGALPTGALVDSKTDASRRETPADDPSVRAHRGAVLWVRADVPDDALDLDGAYSNDTARLTEAVRRACIERAVPAVQRRAVEDEVARDPALRPAGAQSIARLLSEIVREQLADGHGGRQARVARPVQSAGRVGGETYYVDCDAAPSEHAPDAADRTPARLRVARAYVAVLRLAATWRRLAFVDRLSAIAHVTVPSIAVGRSLALQAEVSGLRAEAITILETVEALARDCSASAVGVHVVTSKARLLIDDATRALHDADAAVCDFRAAATVRRASWRDTPPLPTTVNTVTPGWTAAELLPILLPVYPAARHVADPIELVPLLEWAVRRVPNPDFTTRRHGAELLFDQTDALLYAAKQWGGHECLMLAGLAENELGTLRDVRYVLPGLDASAFGERLAAVASLAFLWTDESRAALRRVAMNDPEPGVRRAALWAYGFAQGTNPIALAEAMRQDGETHPLVEELVSRVLSTARDSSVTASTAPTNGEVERDVRWWSW